MHPKVRAKIGLLPTGHDYYWAQFPRLQEMGPSHHIALGIGDHSQALEAFAEAMQFMLVRI